MPLRKPSRPRAPRPALVSAPRLAPSLGRGVVLGLMLSLVPAVGRAQPDPGATIAWHCYRNAVATVLATDKTNSVGTKFLVRASTADPKADCAVEQRPRDSVLGEDGPRDETAHIYIGLVGTALIVDDGTGPDRTLVIYEVPTVRKLLETGYSVQGNCDPTSGCRSEDFSLDDKGLTFWRQIADKPTPKTCPGYAGFMKATGSAAIEERSVFTFANRTVAGSGKKRCTARQ
ncbi:MAG: hypothetical protein INR63_31140 [Actinomycetospora chiangmaiensis]|nr:hypothetical protein [Actinomycetospora chiangmaiensis]